MEQQKRHYDGQLEEQLFCTTRESKSEVTGVVWEKQILAQSNIIP